MKRKPRNPDIDQKQNVVTWFQKRPEAKNHFNPVIGFLVENYLGANYGFINKESYPEYRFNSAGSGETYVVVRASQNHSFLRVRMPFDLIAPQFRDNCKKIKNKEGTKQIEVIDFLISETKHIKLVYDFFRVHKVNNFKKPEKKSWNKFKVSGDKKYTSIRLNEGGMVEVTHEHLRLTEKFIKWVSKKGFKDIKNEYILANKDRIDVRFYIDNQLIFTEMKTVGGSSSKRSIREALGQLLDYQYYNSTIQAKELWIVINDKVDESDIQFIDSLRDMHNLPLRIVWEKAKGFSSHPNLKSI